MVVLNERSSVFEVVTIRPAEPSLRLTHGALDLDLVVGAEAEPHGFVLAGGRHLAAADEHAVAIDRDPAGQQRRVLVLLEARFEERGRIQHRHRAHHRDRARCIAVETRRLLAPSLAPRLTRPGILNTTWKPPTSAAACCSSARSEAPEPAPPAWHRRRRCIGGAGLACHPCRRSRTPSARGGGGYCTISEFRSGALPPRAVRTVETLSATFDQSSPVFWVISARRTSSSAGLRSLAPVSRRAS